ncbi:MAG: Threonine synthase [Methanomassiliicoccales archaeon PtaU1.Bin124]|nr:MAG: Threonine synthase [Methanomassiliicoccales archaeon PtaU1.Bin124]
MKHLVRCFECGREVSDPFVDSCPHCSGKLTIELDLNEVKERSPKELRSRPFGVWRYAPFLPVDASKAVTLKEGGTPLYKCSSLAEKSAIKEVFVKFEGANPTGSFKDRGMTVGVSRAVELGCKVVGCASTGNTSASLAAYAAKARLDSVVLLPSGKVAMGKLAQAMFYGAKVVMVDGNFDDALRVVREMGNAGQLYILNSINPYRPEGQKTVAFEIMDQLEFEVPDRIILPVGNAANIWAVYKAFTEWRELGWIDKIPKLTGIQAAGSAPIVRAFRSGQDDFVPEDHPETIATAIRIGNPASGRKALRAIKDTDGTAIDVTDEEILKAQRMLGRMEGIGVEPASAASIAGLVKLRQMGEIDWDERVVCICTGHVLKDPDTVIKSCEAIIQAKADMESVRKAIGR